MKTNKQFDKNGREFVVLMNLQAPSSLCEFYMPPAFQQDAMAGHLIPHILAELFGEHFDITPTGVYADDAGNTQINWKDRVLKISTKEWLTWKPENLWQLANDWGVEVTVDSPKPGEFMINSD